MIRIGDALQQTITQLRNTQSGADRVRTWTGTVAGPWGVSVRYDCRASSADQARRVIAGLASCDPGQVTDLARVCAIYGPVEAGEPR